MNDSTVMYRKVTYPKVFPNMYLIASDGSCVINTLTGTSMNYYPDKDGYFRVTLRSMKKKSINIGVHRLVAWEYCEGYDEETTNQVDHIDGVKTHNDYTNLEWVTSGENTRRAEKLGLRNSRGENNATAKYTNAEIDAYCRRLASGESIMSIIRDEAGDPMARACDHRALYVLLYKLQHKQLWPDISTKYEYPKSIRDHRNAVPGTGTFKYSEEFIREVCEIMDKGRTDNFIAKCMIDRYSLPYSSLSKLECMVNGIRRGATWLQISKDYLNIRRGFANYIKAIDPVEVCTMYENGYNQEEICKKLLGKKSSPEVRRIISNYRAMKTIDRNTPIEMIHDPLLDLASA